MVACTDIIFYHTYGLILRNKAGDWKKKSPVCVCFFLGFLFYYTIIAKIKTITDLRALTTDTTGQLNILGHDSNTLGMDSAQVGIFK